MSSAAVLTDTPTPTSLKTTSARNGSGGVKSEVAATKVGGGGGTAKFEAHYVVSPEIKNEPPEDINDINSTEDTTNSMEYNNNSSSREGAGSGSGTDSPRIRLTPANKLLATPNVLNPKRKFVCPYDHCTKSYGKSSHLRSHLTWHTGIKPFVCQESHCGKGFTRSDELNRHMRTHTGEKPFECIQCTKKFSRSDHLTKHLATHAKQMSTPLKRVPPNSAERALLRAKRVAAEAAAEAVAAAEVHSSRPDVKKAIFDMESTTAHMTFSEGMHFMAALVNNPDAQFHSEEGDDHDDDDDSEAENLTDDTPMRPIKVMPIKIKLERPDSDQYQIVQPNTSQRQHHSPMKSELSPASVGGRNAYHSTVTPQKLLKAEAPQLARMSNASARRSAHRAYSSEDLPPELIVPVSTMICPSSPEIKTEPNDDAFMPDSDAPDGATTPYGGRGGHHTLPERPFRCRECNRSFKRQDDLNRHVRTHTGEKPFQCNECDRRFMRSDHLKKHLKTHTKLR